MAETKDKVVTVESLSILHEHNKDTYMPMVDPVGSGTMTMNGNGFFSGGLDVNSLTINSNVKLAPNEDGLEIVFLNEGETDDGNQGVTNNINADTLGGKPVSYFATASDVENLYTLVENTADADHIHDERYYLKSEIDDKFDNLSFSEDGSVSIVIDNKLDSTSTNPLQNKVISVALEGKAEKNHTHSYNDLTDKPSIPDNLSTVLGQIDADIKSKADANHTHGEYYTESEIDEMLANLVISGGGTINTITVDDKLDSTSTNPLQNKVISAALDSKADVNHTHGEYYIKSEIDEMLANLTVNGDGNGGASGDGSGEDSTGGGGTVNAEDIVGLDTLLASKVDAVDGKGLSTNDYTTDEKSKLAAIESGATKTIVDSELNANSTNPVQNKIVVSALNNKSDISHTHDEYALANDVSTLQGLVGTTSVDSQIDSKIENALNGFSSGKTLTQHLVEESMVLTSLQYGDTLPAPGITGRIFFLKVNK